MKAINNLKQGQIYRILGTLHPMTEYTLQKDVLVCRDGKTNTPWVESCIGATDWFAFEDITQEVKEREEREEKRVNSEH